MFCLRSLPSEFGVQFGRVSVQSSLEFAKRSRLYLVGILQFANPLGFFRFESGHFTLNLHALFVFFVNLANQLLALCETFLLHLSHAHFDSLVFLIAHHLFHALRLELFCAFLNLNHLFMLSALSLQSFGLSVILFSLSHLLVTDSFLLVIPDLLIAHLEFTLLLLALLLKKSFVVVHLCVALTDIDYVLRFLLCLFDFLPRLRMQAGDLPFVLPV